MTRLLATVRCLPMIGVAWSKVEDGRKFGVGYDARRDAYEVWEEHDEPAQCANKHAEFPNEQLNATREELEAEREISQGWREVAMTQADLIHKQALMINGLIGRMERPK